MSKEKEIIDYDKNHENDSDVEGLDNQPLTDEEKWEVLTRPEKLGELLLKHGSLTLQQLEDLIKEQENSGLPFGELILAKGIMSRSDLLRALDWQHKSDQVIIESLTELINKQKKED